MLEVGSDVAAATAASGAHQARLDVNKRTSSGQRRIDVASRDHACLALRATTPAE
jgi:hypothetical protein